jgi:hypothetical protein
MLSSDASRSPDLQEAYGGMCLPPASAPLDPGLRLCEALLGAPAETRTSGVD